MNEDKNKQLFISLVYSSQMQAMMQLGKLANPVTSTIERELESAQITIDMLDMLKVKTKNNIEAEEQKFLEQVIADLKLNFVEERDKEMAESKKEDKSESTKKSDDKKKASGDGKPSAEKSDKDISVNSDTGKREKPLPEQFDEDEKKPVPPQE